MLVLAFVCALAFATWGAARASADGPYKVAVYSTIHTSEQGLTGHVFVQLRHDGTNEIWGKYPGGWWVFDTNGDLRFDGSSKWSWRITYTVSHSSWTAAFDYLEAQVHHPDAYRLFTDNCVEFAAEVVRRAGHHLPHYRFLGSVPDPSTLTLALEGTGNGNLFDGGRVLHNPDPDHTASGAPDPPPATPPCCDVTGIIKTATADPRTLARSLRLQFRKYSLAPGTPGAGGRFTVKITHTDVRRNLYVINWGDGSTTDGVLPRSSVAGTVTFSHRYVRGWHGSLRAVVLENGRVLEYVQPLRPRGAGSHVQIDAEPAPPPPRAYVPHTACPESEVRC